MLKNIKTIKCPICGCADIVEESVETSSHTDVLTIREHCNGTRWESRKFLCGYKTNFIPNFLSEEKDKYCDCSNDLKVIARKEKEKQDKENFIKLLNENNISESIIEKVKRYCL